MAVALTADCRWFVPGEERCAGDGSEIGPVVAATIMRQLPALVQSRV